jgi:chorismate mutase/prephenate dehydratase
MPELDILRGGIDEVDKQIVHLFERRMELTRKVGEYKQARNMAVLDPKREREVIEQKLAQLGDPHLKTDVILLYETIMGISRRQQRQLVQEGRGNPLYDRCMDALARSREPVAHPRVTYQGAPGAFSETAAINFFGDDMDCQGLPQFEDVFRSLHDGQADYGVLPIENSTTGAIRQIYDLLTQYECYIVGETTVKVEHCLLANPGATLDTITHVYSHEQGLFQSEKFLNQHPDWVQVPHGDTAGSAKYVAETGDLTKAAICAERAADLYGLEVLVRGTNYSQSNTTRFVVVSPRLELREGADKISTVFTLPHQSGTLNEILTIFAVHGLNMVRLESRPLPGRSWEYMFFLEFTGALGPQMDGVLHELTQTVEDFRLFGNFKSNLGANYGE